MSVTAQIMDGPLPPREGSGPLAAIGRSGALVCFEGVVRAVEAGRPLAALDYECYEPMAGNELLRLAREIHQRHALLRVEVLHSRGRVGVGECSFRLTVESAHRSEALAAMDEFIDRMKRDVPIWKHAVFAEGQP